MHWVCTAPGVIPEGGDIAAPPPPVMLATGGTPQDTRPRSQVHSMCTALPLTGRGKEKLVYGQVLVSRQGVLCVWILSEGDYSNDSSRRRVGLVEPVSAQGCSSGKETPIFRLT